MPVKVTTLLINANATLFHENYLNRFDPRLLVSVRSRLNFDLRLFIDFDFGITSSSITAFNFAGRLFDFISFALTNETFSISFIALALANCSGVFRSSRRFFIFFLLNSWSPLARLFVFLLDILFLLFSAVGFGFTESRSFSSLRCFIVWNHSRCGAVKPFRLFSVLLICISSFANCRSANSSSKIFSIKLRNVKVIDQLPVKCELTDLWLQTS